MRRVAGGARAKAARCLCAAGARSCATPEQGSDLRPSATAATQAARACRGYRLCLAAAYRWFCALARWRCAEDRPRPALGTARAALSATSPATRRAGAAPWASARARAKAGAPRGCAHTTAAARGKLDLRLGWGRPADDLPPHGKMPENQGHAAGHYPSPGAPAENAPLPLLQTAALAATRGRDPSGRSSASKTRTSLGMGRRSGSRSCRPCRPSQTSGRPAAAPRAP